MSDFSPTEAALEGLRVSRERPTAILWWWAAYIVFNVVQVGVSALTPFRRFDDLLPALQTAWQAALAHPNDAAVMSRYTDLAEQAAPGLFLFAALGLAVYLILSTAALRAVLRPADQAFGYLRMSLDELRQFGLALVAFAAFMLYAFLISRLLALAIWGLGAVVPAPALGLAAFIIIPLAFLYPAVRLSLAPALTFADRRISLLRAWSLTRGRFWPLFGAYLIALTIAAVLWLAVSTLFVLFLLATGSPLKPPVLHGLAGLLSPAALLTLVVSSLLTALVGVIVNAPIAAAFRQLSEAGPTPKPTLGPPPAPRSGANSPWG